MAALPGFAQVQTAPTVDDTQLSGIIVRADRVANIEPAGSYAALATALRFDPLVELQSRGLPEGQSDVTVRGGLFRNTGFKVGAVTIMDPQTGHFTAAMPIDPAALSRPDILTGIGNALHGFNSSIATVAYAIPTITESGAVSLGGGSDGLRFHSLRFAAARATADGGDLAFAASAASSRGDGSLPFGDHEFDRYNIHVQRSNDGAQTDLILGYQDKFYGWPGAYTGFATPETDHTRTTLILANHRKHFGDGWFEIGAVHRRLEDNYDFDRTTQESGGPGAFEHETVVNAVGFRGLYRRGRIDWHFGGQVTADELVHSTDLTHGDFDHRQYLKVGIAPSIDIVQSGDHTISIRAGATFDASNRDSNAFSPLLGITFSETSGDSERFVVLEYAATTQLPGYTALKSPPAGLFGGNADLGRETSAQWLLSIGETSHAWDGKITFFYRQDDDLVDWTYLADAPFARQANPVDASVSGVEARFSRRWADLGLAAGYTYLDKDADYGAARVDASYYALNYARHRATLAATWRWTDRLEWRMDTEYRVQRPNPLRTTANNALIVSLALAWQAAHAEGLSLALTADNLTDSDFETFPGTPAVGRQVSLRVRYGW